MDAKISYVASTGGVKIEGNPDTWYNPVKSIKDEVMKLEKGDFVNILLDGTRIVGISKKDEEDSVVNEGEVVIDDVVVENPVVKGVLDKDRLIVRQNVLSRAVEMFLAGKIDKGDVKVVAEDLEGWVFR